MTSKKLMKPKKERFAWIPAEIRSYKPLYKGRRYWVFENDFKRPFKLQHAYFTQAIIYEEFIDEKYDQILVYDAMFRVISATGHLAADGQIHGCHCKGQGLTFTAKDPADMASTVGCIDKRDL